MNTDSPVEILLAEDSPTQAERVAFTLRSSGFRVDVAPNGREALTKARARKPTLLLSDINMPEMDGYELCREIRRDRNLADLPVILLTSLSDPEDVFRALECGADNFISKPCEDDYLLTRIQHLLSNHPLRGREPVEEGVEVFFGGRRHSIMASRRQVLNLLLSTYEAAVQKNHALTEARDELRALNEQLEERVQQRTAALQAEVEERKRAEDQVRRLNDELEQRVRARTAELEAANRELDSFAHSISHDLRAPLRAIRGFAEILVAQHAAELTEEPRRLLGIIGANVKRMGQLIDDLMLFSRTSRQPLRKLPVRMSVVVQEAIEAVRPATETRKVDFVMGELPDCVGDASLLKQVWINLLANAVKFTRPRESARIEIGCEASNPERIYFVRDNGVGFDAAHAGRLFGVFERLHRADEFEGTGIGLSIVHRIIARHGGRIWAEGRKGEGATFRFSLPC